MSAAFTCSAFSQQTASRKGFRDLFKAAEVRPDYSLRLDNRNEFRLILTGGFAAYKILISSQDGMTCTFYPSCSVYALNSVKTNGILGILDAIDRLTRCNGISPEKYTIHQPSQRFYDPVRKIHR